MEDSRKAGTIDVLFTALGRRTKSLREKEIVQDVSLLIPLEPGKCFLREINGPPAQLQNRAPRSAARPWSAATIWPRPQLPSLPARAPVTSLHTSVPTTSQTITRSRVPASRSGTTPRTLRAPGPPGRHPRQGSGKRMARPETAARCGLLHPPHPDLVHVLGGHSPASARSGLSAEPGRPSLPTRASRTPQGRTRQEGGKAGSGCSCEAPRAGRRGRRSQRAGPRVARAEAALRSRRGSGSGGSLTHHGPAGQRAGGPGQGPAEPPRPARAGPTGALGAAVVRDHDEVLHGCGSRPSQRADGRQPGRRQRRR